MKKIIFILALALSINAYAQDNKTVTLVVSGQGKTQDEAKQNALRSAIEQAFGTFISSKTEILNDELVKDEIVSVGEFSQDETPRAETSLEKMASLNPLVEGHDITAAISSQNADASSAILIVSEKILKEHNLTPLARIAHISVRADDPIWMLTAPMPATEYAIKKSGINLSDIDIVEINEAFASVAMAWQKEMNYPMSQINPNGGAIALGHPLGATGARLMTTMVHTMKRNNLRYGLQTMCEGGGQANVTILENCSLVILFIDSLKVILPL